MIQFDHEVSNVFCLFWVDESPDGFAFEFDQFGKIEVIHSKAGLFNFPDYFFHDEVELMAERLGSEGQGFIVEPFLKLYPHFAEVLVLDVGLHEEIFVLLVPNGSEI